MSEQKIIPVRELKHELIQKAIDETKKFQGDKEHAEAIKTLVEAFEILR